MQEYRNLLLGFLTMFSMAIAVGILKVIDILFGEKN